MLAFLHTSPVHVPTFDHLAREHCSDTPIVHEVQEHLLSAVLAAGNVTDAVRASIVKAVQALANGGAKVIVCTCSTIGSEAETAGTANGVVVMRIDRPMAEQAVASGRRIIVLATLQSTFQPTTALLHRIASDAERSVELVEVLCEQAWRAFEVGDHAGYIGDIAKTIEATARPGDLVLLAQASMAPAAELVRHLGVPILSSPVLGVQAAMSKYRAFV